MNKSDLMPDFPVPGFPMKFIWQKGDWVDLFNEQIKLIKEDIYRAKVQGKLIIYLSCPISSRGGGYSGTNVEIAEFTRMRLLREWGTGFWILNPASYQMESKAGTGLMHRHAKNIWKDLSDAEAELKLTELAAKTPAKDGDYMRMWTKVLVEDEEEGAKKNLGYHFDGFYFLSPTDVRSYFLSSDEGDLTSSIQNYFSRKFSTDPEFKDYYSVNGIRWGVGYNSKDEETPPDHTADEKRIMKHWEKKRHEFFRFYALRASVNYSAGGHDEWNIWRLLNKMRISYYDSDDKLGRKEGIGDLIPAYFDAKQVTPADFLNKAITGYEIDASQV